jgi:hypothetical protein
MHAKAIFDVLPLLVHQSEQIEYQPPPPSSSRASTKRKARACPVLPAEEMKALDDEELRDDDLADSDWTDLIRSTDEVEQIQRLQTANTNTDNTI